MFNIYPIERQESKETNYILCTLSFLVPTRYLVYCTLNNWKELWKSMYFLILSFILFIMSFPILILSDICTYIAMQEYKFLLRIFFNTIAYSDWFELNMIEYWTKPSRLRFHSISFIFLRRFLHDVGGGEEISYEDAIAVRLYVHTLYINM